MLVQITMVLAGGWLGYAGRRQLFRQFWVASVVLSLAAIGALAVWVDTFPEDARSILVSVQLVSLAVQLLVAMVLGPLVFFLTNTLVGKR